MRKAFTLMELVVALAILAVVLSFAGVIFRVSIDSHRMALANAEILQKLRVITDQLDADFRSLCKDGEIFVVWGANRVPPDPEADPTASPVFNRFDSIMFFTTGDFQTYAANPQPERGNMARICYMLARGPSINPAEPNWPQRQKPYKRILARTQHILIPPALNSSISPLDTNDFTTDEWLAWSSDQEVDRISLEGWKRIPLLQKYNILSVIGDVNIVDQDGKPLSTTEKAACGVLIDPAEPNSIHSLFCRGVGQFMVQGWNDAEGRWMPAVDPNEDNDLTDSDFPLTADKTNVKTDKPVLWYPRQRNSLDPNSVDYMDKDHFGEIPGLGRALKFTFTLYDSRHLIKDGRTFTHIVYLDD